MKKPWIGIVLGALVYFLAGMLEWTVLPWHNSVIKKMPEENLIRDSLKVVVPESGFYFLPSNRKDDGQHIDQKEYAKKMKEGPAAVVLFNTSGKDYMSPKKILIEFVMALIISGFCFWLLCLSSSVVTTYLSRVSLVVLLGLFQWFASHLPYMLWFFFPPSYVLIIALDSFLSFSLLGIVLAGFVTKE